MPNWASMFAIIWPKEVSFLFFGVDQIYFCKLIFFLYVMLHHVIFAWTLYLRKKFSIYVIETKITQYIYRDACDFFSPILNQKK